MKRIGLKCIHKRPKFCLPKRNKMNAFRVLKKHKALMQQNKGFLKGAVINILLMSFCLCLLSCSPYKRSFNCPHPQGKPCTSLSRIHELIDQGAFQDLEKTKPNAQSCSSTRCCAKSDTQDVPALIIYEAHERTVMLQAPTQTAPSQISKGAT